MGRSAFDIALRSLALSRIRNQTYPLRYHLVVDASVEPVLSGERGFGPKGIMADLQKMSNQDRQTHES